LAARASSGATHVLVSRIHISMDVPSFLKMVPAVLGTAGLLTYVTRARQSGSDHDIVRILQGTRTIFVVLACAALIGLTWWLFYGSAPPDHDAALSLGKFSPFEFV
jgi:EamA domain-containing membrane protein RarD